MALELNGPLVRRLRLAAKPRPAGVRGPSLRLWLGEGLRIVPTRRAGPLTVPLAPHPHQVVLFPGLAAHTFTMRRLRRALETAGHRVHDWGEGLNLGPTEENLVRLVERVEALAQAAGAPVMLVGWSLGGIFAREVARRVPGAVAGVVTMGSPFSGDRHANNAWRTYHLITGHDVADPPVRGDPAAKPPVPTVALWSPRDGIVAPRCACGRPGERDRAIALRCTHFGFSADPAAIGVVLGLLDGTTAWV
ncbi:MAG: alpha/beta hydrolase [Novosphingobium sp.]|uniref:lipase family alpha/beta hydrolase n=1 Tax=Novosphingobium sp. TaxID=1874826 RepID=UPI0017FD5DBD|nr:alpha/beta hydrolase [Novosphingobium sp.]